MALSIPSNAAAIDPQQQLAKHQTPVQRTFRRAAGNAPLGLTATEDVVDLGRSSRLTPPDSEGTPVADIERLRAARTNSALAKITDADMADGQAAATAAQIRSQPRDAYLAQANLSAENVRSLLR